MRISVFFQITAKRFSYFERSFSIIRNALFEFRQGLIVELNERKERERRKKIRSRLNIRRKIPIFADRWWEGKSFRGRSSRSRISKVEVESVGICRNIALTLRMTLMFDTCSSGFAARPIICC